MDNEDHEQNIEAIIANSVGLKILTDGECIELQESLVGALNRMNKEEREELADAIKAWN
tara:strand:- start:128 stop:304 length:177 start_codon:yes stop_codon:yes gene_type:complete